MRPNITLGDEVKDIVTGFTGIVTAVTVWRNGMQKAQVQPQGLHDGKPYEPLEFDYEDLTIINVGAVKATTVRYKGPIEMGDEVKDKSGYIGVVEEIRTSLSGCIQFGAYARKMDKDGMPVRGILRHSDDYTLVKKAVAPVTPVKKGTGAARSARSAR